ncbi:hypothetical protein [Microbacterium sp. E-13]|uniref:hypothetical protein n=1 Tax=Microbacterium sp. E-13 TaxID=3404048 RepID=UPI003CF5ADC4
MAQADDFTGQPSHGLDELLDATFRVAPEGVRVALTAAQMIDLGRKFRQAQLAVWAAGAVAGATSVFLKEDPKALPTVVLGMTGSVAAVYGVPEEVAAVAWAAAATAVTAGRGSVTDGLLALIPQEKISAQHVVTGLVAGSFVVAVGYAWTAVCGQLAQGKLEGLGGVLQEGMIRDLFLAQFKRKFAQETGETPTPS